MARIPETLNVGDRENLTIDRLLIIIETLYTELAQAVNQKPDFISRTTNGQTTDTFLNLGTLNLNTSTNNVEMLVAKPTAATVTWKAL